MNRIMTPAATIISIIAVFTALNLMWVKREMSMILAKEMPERTGGPPIIAPFDIMLKRAKNLPLEDWGPAH